MFVHRSLSANFQFRTRVVGSWIRPWSRRNESIMDMADITTHITPRCWEPQCRFFFFVAGLGGDDMLIYLVGSGLCFDYNSYVPSFNWDDIQICSQLDAMLPLFSAKQSHSTANWKKMAMFFKWQSKPPTSIFTNYCTFLYLVDTVYEK